MNRHKALLHLEYVHHFLDQVIELDPDNQWFQRTLKLSSQLVLSTLEKYTENKKQKNENVHVPTLLMEKKYGAADSNLEHGTETTTTTATATTTTTATATTATATMKDIHSSSNTGWKTCVESSLIPACQSLG
ncbi:hypothetical protein CHS0354_021094 [Potamilus streckersoni]|uniref:Uncharacterized protein n=1 Tax=Potamilus streckersoni TaxID=2493646 RepID=A0AAE0SEC1_9BIVA|nr:hypothetical protein CHS0354_021094 [Potamilus streckersoni]